MKVLVTGAKGLVGSAISRNFRSKGLDVVGITKEDCNLLNRNDTFKMLRKIKPNLVICAAAKVGGIVANQKTPVNFLNENLQIQGNIFDAAIENKVDNLIFLGSSCIYPKNCSQPIKEDYLMTGALEPTNSAYAVAKIAGLEAIKAIRNQYGYRWISLMPTNIYGPNDNFNLETSHVLPAIIRKFIEAKNGKLDSVKLLGDGSPRREFIHSDDLAEAVYVAWQKYDNDQHLNIGVGEDYTIKELSEMVCAQIGFKGQIEWDLFASNGTPRKLLDNSRITSLGWQPSVRLEEGIRDTILWYEKALLAGEVRI